MKELITSTWLKNRGYLHLSKQVNIKLSPRALQTKIQNKQFVAKYAFHPLIHSIIKERRYKRIDSTGQKRAHSYIKENVVVKQIKSRPLHYATHLDAIIFGYYADLLQKEYEQLLNEHTGLSECITAYRRIKDPETQRSKSTINFACEAFQEIKRRSLDGCVVLKLDIKNFFSNIDHNLLKKLWAGLLKQEKLPDDHFNVFKAATRFSYILLDDLRLQKKVNGKRAGFDEKRLAQIRKKGVQAFFETSRELRDGIREKKFKVYKFPFRNEKKESVGIPQGLPISAVLANLYLLNFDIQILDKVVNEMGGFYRRYSDDIIIICRPGALPQMEQFIKEKIKESCLTISDEKTERFLFKKMLAANQELKTTSIKLSESASHIGYPFTYLGFEFYGEKILIKSANLAKFYRRMIYAVKSKAKKAVAIAANNPGTPVTIFKRQLYKLYTIQSLNASKIYKTHKKLIPNQLGEFVFEISTKPPKHKSNYLSYVNRASDIMKEPAIRIQIAKHRSIFNQAVTKYLKKYATAK